MPRSLLASPHSARDACRHELGREAQATPPRHRGGLGVGALLALALASCAVASCDTGSAQSQGSGPKGLPRLGAPERPTRDELLTDFEDESLSFEFIAGQGHLAPKDGNGAETLVLAEGGPRDSAVALHVTRAPAEVTVHLQHPEGARVLHDLSSCDGLRFWAKAHEDSTTLRLAAVSSKGSAEATWTVSDEWTEVILEWGDLESSKAGQGGAPGSSEGSSEGSGTSPGVGGAGGGSTGLGGSEPGGESVDGSAGAVSEERGPFDPGSVLRFEFSAGGSFWLDELTLTACALPRLNPERDAPPTLGSAGPAKSPVAEHGQLRVEGKTLVDQSGKPVQLKGVSSMWTNWDASAFATNKDALRELRDSWEISVFRIAMGVEESGAYLSSPGTHRRKVERAIENAVELGVYLIVDWHAHEATKDPDAARGFFAEMAERYGHLPNVIWETFNEPLQVSWSRALKPYHLSLIETIRAHDPDNLILLGTPQWSQLVDEAAADPIGASNVMYVLHFYACTHQGWLRELGDQALDAGIGLFVSEFGGTHADGGRDGVVCEAETRSWFDWMDARGVSGVAWKLDACATDSSCLLTTAAPKSGPWTEEHLHGHAPLVLEWLRR